MLLTNKGRATAWWPARMQFSTVPYWYLISVTLSSIILPIWFSSVALHRAAELCYTARAGALEVTMLASRSAAVAALSFILLTPAAAQPHALTVDLRSFGYAPAPIRLAAGKPITLTFVNRSGSRHDFTARSFFANSRILSGSAPRGRIDVGPRQTAIITLIPRAGTYPVHCSRFLHKQMGMRGLVVVG